MCVLDSTHSDNYVSHSTLGLVTQRTGTQAFGGPSGILATMPSLQKLSGGLWGFLTQLTQIGDQRFWFPQQLYTLIAYCELSRNKMLENLVHGCTTSLLEDFYLFWDSVESWKQKITEWCTALESEKWKEQCKPSRHRTHRALERWRATERCVRVGNPDRGPALLPLPILLGKLVTCFEWDLLAKVMGFLPFPKKAALKFRGQGSGWAVGSLLRQITQPLWAWFPCL